MAFPQRRKVHRQLYRRQSDCHRSNHGIPGPGLLVERKEAQVYFLVRDEICESPCQQVKPAGRTAMKKADTGRCLPSLVAGHGSGSRSNGKQTGRDDGLV